jgi:cullin 3
VIFRYLNDKDIFESYYKTFLSKRLLGGKGLTRAFWLHSLIVLGINDEMERIMISKLKSECGYQFTSKLEGMFTDIRLSKSTLDDYSATIGSSVSCPFEFDISILTAGFWPSSTESQFCRIPPLVMAHCIDPFAAYYFSKLTGRKLSWQFQLGSADVRANFSGGKRELTVTTYQMFILLLFNENETLSLGEIREGTGIPESELRRHLLSLCTPKFKILNKLSKIKV